MGDIEYDIIGDKLDTGIPLETLALLKKRCGSLSKQYYDLKKYQDKYMATLSVEDSSIFRSIKKHNNGTRASFKKLIKEIYDMLYKDKVF